MLLLEIFQTSPRTKVLDAGAACKGSFLLEFLLQAYTQ